MKQLISNNKYGGALGIILITLVLTLLALAWQRFPFDNFSSQVIGYGDTVTFTALSHQAFENLLHRPTDLGYGLFYFGEAAPMAYTVAPYSLIISLLPIYLLTGQSVELTLNIYIILTFILTAFATHLLIQYLLKPSLSISYITALMVAFAQFRFMQLGHIETLSTHLLIFSLYFFHRLVDEQKLRWAIALGISFWLTFFTSGYLGYMFIIMSGLILFYYYFTNNIIINSRTVILATISAIVVITLAVPIIAFRIENSVSLEGYSISTTSLFSARPLDWLSGNSFLYAYLIPSQSREGNLFIGFIPIILAVLAWRFQRKKAEFFPRAEKYDRLTIAAPIYLLITVTGYFLTLGPRINISENFVLPSPYMLLLQLPGFSSIRVPNRFILLAVIGIAVLSAITLKILQEKWSSKWHFIVIFISACLFIELVPYNNAFLSARQESSYSLLSTLRRNTGEDLYTDNAYLPLNLYSWLQQQPEGTAVFNYPFENDVHREYMRGLRYHGQPMLNGRASFVPDWHYSLYVLPFPSASLVDTIREQGVKYILVHNDLLTTSERVAVTTQIPSMIYGRWLKFENNIDNVDIYEILPAVGTSSIFRFEFDRNLSILEDITINGWHNMEYAADEGLTFMWTSEATSTITLPLPTSDSLILTFRIVNSITPEFIESLRVYVNGSEITINQENADTFTGVISPSLKDNGSDRVTLSFVTNELARPTSTDARKLGLAFDWIDLKPAHGTHDLAEQMPYLYYDFDQTTIDETGWDVPESNLGEVTFRWMNATSSTLLVETPTIDDTVFTFKVYASLEPDILDSLSIRINDKAIEFSKVIDGMSPTYIGIIPRTFVNEYNGSIPLTFEVDRIVSPSTQDPRHLAIAFDWLLLYPLNTPAIVFDNPIPGSNWSAPKFTPLTNISYAWTTAEVANVNFMLPPMKLNQDWKLRFKVINLSKSDVIDGLTVTLNRQPLPLKRIRSLDGDIFELTLPEQVLKLGNAQIACNALSTTGQRYRSCTDQLLEFRLNELEYLNLSTDQGREVGIAFDWLTIEPE